VIGRTRRGAINCSVIPLLGKLSDWLSSLARPGVRDLSPSQRCVFAGYRPIGSLPDGCMVAFSAALG
jgi:hypothetical protein